MSTSATDGLGARSRPLSLTLALLSIVSTSATDGLGARSHPLSLTLALLSLTLEGASSSWLLSGIS